MCIMRRRWRLLLAVLLMVVALVLAVPIVAVSRARGTHNRQLADLRARTLHALALVGVQGVLVSEGIDGGGYGSADCGVHVVAVLNTSRSASEVAQALRQPNIPVLAAVYEDAASHRVVVVAQEPAATGAASLLDFRCGGPIPYDDQPSVE